MREIKFRAWDEYLKCFYYDGFSISPHGIIDPQMQNRYVYSNSPNLLMLEQFTGLLDKNGKEIFEGDILQHPTIKDLGPVEWDEYYASFDWLHPKMYGWSMSDAEIIGNIHENPELLA